MNNSERYKIILEMIKENIIHFRNLYLKLSCTISEQEIYKLLKYKTNDAFCCVGKLPNPWEEKIIKTTEDLKSAKKSVEKYEELYDKFIEIILKKI